MLSMGPIFVLKSVYLPEAFTNPRWLSNDSEATRNTIGYQTDFKNYNMEQADGNIVQGSQQVMPKSVQKYFGWFFSLRLVSGSRHD